MSIKLTGLYTVLALAISASNCVGMEKEDRAEFPPTLPSQPVDDLMGVCIDDVPSAKSPVAHYKNFDDFSDCFYLRDTETAWIFTHESGLVMIRIPADFKEPKYFSSFLKTFSSEIFTFKEGESTIGETLLKVYGEYIAPLAKEYSAVVKKLSEHYVAAEEKETGNFTLAFLKALPSDLLESMPFEEKIRLPLEFFNPEAALTKDVQEQLQEFREGEYPNPLIGHAVIKSILMNAEIVRLDVPCTDLYRIRPGKNPPRPRYPEVDSKTFYEQDTSRTQSSHLFY